MSLLPEYLYYSLIVAKEELKSSGQGTTFSELSGDALASFRMPFPAHAEQTAIVHFLDQATTKTDKRIADTHQEVDLLREYRTRLIADVVTGQLDVREAAVALPEESDVQDVVEASG